MADDKKCFNREKKEANTSRLIQFKVPSSNSFKPSVNQTDFNKTPLKFINDNLDKTMTYQPPQSFELTQSELCGHLYTKVNKDIQQDLSKKSTASCDSTQGLSLKKSQKENLFMILLDKLKNNNIPDPCNFFSSISMLLEFIKDAGEYLQQGKISLTDFNLMINYLNDAKNKTECLL